MPMALRMSFSSNTFHHSIELRMPVGRVSLSLPPLQWRRETACRVPVSVYPNMPARHGFYGGARAEGL
jgi:hypothetical protein